MYGKIRLQGHVWVGFIHASPVPHCQSDIKALVAIPHKIKPDEKQLLPGVSYSRFWVKCLFFNQFTCIPEVTNVCLPFWQPRSRRENGRGNRRQKRLWIDPGTPREESCPMGSGTEWNAVLLDPTKLQWNFQKSWMPWGTVFPAEVGEGCELGRETVNGGWEVNSLLCKIVA